MRSESTSTDILERMGYESQDVNVRQVLLAVVGLIVFFIVSMIGIILFYSIFIPDWAKLNRPEPIPVNRRVPPHPQIQVDPKRDFELYRQAEDKEVAGQGAAMSIDKAIDTMATQQGVAGVRGDALRERGTGYPGQTSASASGHEAGGHETGAGHSAASEKTEAHEGEHSEGAGHGAH